MNPYKTHHTRFNAKFNFSSLLISFFLAVTSLWSTAEAQFNSFSTDTIFNSLSVEEKMRALEYIKQNPQELKKHPKLAEEINKEGQFTTTSFNKMNTFSSDSSELTRSLNASYSQANKMTDTSSKTQNTQQFNNFSSNTDSIQTLKQINSQRINSSDKVFGFQLFDTPPPALSLRSVPEEYIINAGDQISLRLWGRYNFEKIYNIGEDGKVFIDPLNRQEYLKGMSHARLKEFIGKIISDMPGVEGEVQVIASNPIQIRVSGEAKVPGQILIPPYYTFWHTLLLSGGPSNFGSLRDIRLVRNGSVIYKLDIYDFFQSGKAPEMGLRENDMIFFGPVQNKVSISGITKKSGIFEIKTGETLEDLVQIAGGFNNNEYAPFAEIERILNISKRELEGPTREIIDVSLTNGQWKNFKLQDSDKISEKTRGTELLNYVSIYGNGIRTPGRYALTNSTQTLEKLLKSAGGLKQGYSNQIEIIRNENGKLFSIQIDLKVTNTTLIDLAPRDSILTYSLYDFQDGTLIKVSGYVRNPGTFPYADSITLSNAINRAGGLVDGSLDYVFLKQSTANGKISYKKIYMSEASQYVLAPRDEILAFSYKQFNGVLPVLALMDGKEPLVLEYSENLTIEKIIHELGGLSPLVDSNRIELNFPDFSSVDILVNTSYVSLSPQNLNNSQFIVPGTLIIFREDPRKKSAEFVHLKGPFTIPGNYALANRNTDVSDILKLAQGLTTRANPYSLAVIRSGYPNPIPIRIQSTSPLKFQGKWLLADGDTIVVARNDFNVKVSGMVLNPGIVPFQNSFDWEEYINQGAGGALDTAQVKKTYIVYPNGIAVKAKKGWFSSGKVVPGSEIVVPMKPYVPPPSPSEKFDYKEFMASLTATLTVILTVLLITDKVGN